MKFRNIKNISKKLRATKKKSRTRKFLLRAMKVSILMLILLASQNVSSVHLLLNDMFQPDKDIAIKPTFSSSGLRPNVKNMENETWNKSHGIPWEFKFNDKISSSETSSYSDENVSTVYTPTLKPSGSLPPKTPLKPKALNDDRVDGTVSLHHMDEATVKINKLCTVFAYVFGTLGCILGVLVLANYLSKLCTCRDRPVPLQRALTDRDIRRPNMVPSLYHDRLYYPQLVIPDFEHNHVFYVRNEATGEVI